MKILMATPCHAHNAVVSEHEDAFDEMRQFIADSGHQLGKFKTDIAPISRARDAAAKVAMENDFDKLWFVDADIVWKPQHLEMLLQSDKKIIGGTYPLKRYPIHLVFNAVKEHLDYWNSEKRTMPEYRLLVKNFANEKGELEVFHLPTGFMMIDVSVLKEMAPSRRKYSFFSHTNGDVVFHEFFPFLLKEQAGTDVMRYEAEDWGFCSEALKLGYKTYLQTKCIVDHVGMHKFSAGEL